jgi:hypothetical protein
MTKNKIVQPGAERHKKRSSKRWKRLKEKTVERCKRLQTFCLLLVQNKNDAKGKGGIKRRRNNQNLNRYFVLP